MMLYFCETLYAHSNNDENDINNNSPIESIGRDKI